MRSYFSRHAQVLIATFGTMRRTPVTSFNTVLIVAITLLLPALLYVMIKSALLLSDGWQGRPQVSIFMQTDVGPQQAQLIFSELQLHPAIELAEFVSPQQALEEFKALSGMDKELDFIGQNPLPSSIVIMPSDNNAKSIQLLELKEELSKIEGIESIRLDLDWVDRFNAIVTTASKFSALLSGLLGFALVLIVGNTIKLLIYNRRQEIEVIRLVGGSNAFVRRPFLYYGMLFGLLGALVSLGLLFGSAKLLQHPLAQLSDLYQKQTLIYSLNGIEISTLLLIGAVIGWLAARWSVSRHLAATKPR